MDDRHDWAGRFVWYDLMCTDVEAAKAFYSELFGWRFDAVPMGEHTFTVIKAGERAVGGVMPLEPDFPMGSHWMSYLSVADVDASCERVTELGGEVCYAGFDLPNVGRTAIVGDPNGAVFHLFRSTTPGATTWDGAPGTFCWTQLLTASPEAAQPFYTGLVPWEAQASDYAAGQVVFQRPGDPWPLASLLPKPSDAELERDAWLPFVAVADCAEATRRAVALGAKIRIDTQDVGGMALMSVFTDPTGAQLAIWETVTQIG